MKKATVVRFIDPKDLAIRMKSARRVRFERPLTTNLGDVLKKALGKI